MNYLNGGDGDDRIEADGGGIVTAGDGADVIFTGNWITPDDPAVDVVDYDQTEDQLVIVWDLSAGVSAVDVQPTEDSAEDMRVMVDGREILRVSGAEGLSVSDLVILDHADAEALGLCRVGRRDRLGQKRLYIRIPKPLKSVSRIDVGLWVGVIWVSRRACAGRHPGLRHNRNPTKGDPDVDHC